MTRRRSRSRAGPAIAFVIAGFGAGAALASAAIHRRTRAKTTSPSGAEEIVRRLLEEPWRGRLDVVDELVASAYVGHDPSEPEPIEGADGYKAQVRTCRDAFPDARVATEETLIDGDRVTARWTARGTQSGEIAGIAPTGKQVTVTGITIFELEGGQVVESWSSWDTLGLLVQLGAVPAPAAA